MVFVPQRGQLLGRYELLEELGRGGMAVVFRARDSALARDVAIKIMHAHLWGTADNAARFSREARAVAALRHPNIVEVYDYSEGEKGEHEVPGYIVSELVRGPTLREFIDANGHPLPEVAALIGLKLAEALSCAHKQNIIHRDLKPENVMVAEGGRPVLTDFGIARIAEGESVTQTGTLLGSPAYMSPEQARGLHVDARSDLFSLGVVLYLLSTGALPFVGKDALATVLRVLEGAYDPPLKRNQQVGTALDRIIRRLLQSDPEKRFGSAGEVAAALRQVLAEAEIADPDLELREYFSSPGEYNQRLVPRVVSAALTLAEQARAEKDHARMLRLCDRVLAFVPDHPTALTLMQSQISAGAGRRRLLALGLAGVALLAGAVSLGLVHWRARRSTPRDVVLLRGVATDRGLPDLVRADASVADGSPADLAPDRRRQRRRPHPLHATAPALADAGIRPAARADARSRPLRPVTDQAELVVLLGPFCDLSIDGKPVGLSPDVGPVRLSPRQPHQIRCRHSVIGEYRETVTLNPGERRTISAWPPVRVRLRLSSGDAVRIEKREHRGELHLQPNRYRVELLRQGAVVSSAYVNLMRNCTLVDVPALDCR